MNNDETVRRYHAAKNKDGAALPGVPNRDLTHGEFRALPKWLQSSVDASGFWSEPAPAVKPSVKPTVKPKPKPTLAANLDPKPEPKPADEQPAMPAGDGA